MRLIFLDIDGVLNSENDFGGKRKPNPYVITDTGEKYWGISKAKVRNLKDIVINSDAKIVLISSWKHDYIDYITNGFKNKTGKYLYNKLKEFDLEIYDTTLKYDPANRSKYREAAILKYLSVHRNIDNYIILDDEVYVYTNKELLEHLINTNEETGLDVLKTAQAIYKLTGIKTDMYKQHEFFTKFCDDMVGKIFPDLVVNDDIVAETVPLKNIKKD